MRAITELRDRSPRREEEEGHGKNLGTDPRWRTSKCRAGRKRARPRRADAARKDHLLFRKKLGWPPKGTERQVC